MKLPPQPKGSFLSGHLKAFRQDPIGLMLSATKEFDDIMLFRVLGKKIYLVNHPDHVEHILQKKHKIYHKSPSYDTIRLWGGDGIFTSDAEAWLERRKLYQPAFTNTSIQSYTSLVIQNSEEMIDDWAKQLSKEDKINISMEMSKITMFIISESLFSRRIEFGSEIWKNTSYALEWIGHRILRRPFVWPAKFPTKSNRKFFNAVSEMDKMVYELIETKKINNDNPNDLLSRFMDPGDPELKKFNTKELRDEIMTLFIAGHETSANVLSWTYYIMASRPDIQDKMFEEVARLGKRTLQFEDMHQLQYIIQVLNEVMRLYPPVWHIGRMNIEDDEIGGYPIPKGSHIRISPLTMHRKKAYFENPEEFDPDRFTPEKSKQQIPFTYIPFGAGPRLCAGRNFAMMEMVLILASTIRSFKFSYSGPEIEMAPLMTLRSKGDIVLNVNRR